MGYFQIDLKSIINTLTFRKFFPYWNILLFSYETILADGWLGYIYDELWTLYIGLLWLWNFSQSLNREEPFLEHRIILFLQETDKSLKVYSNKQQITLN